MNDKKDKLKPVNTKAAIEDFREAGVFERIVNSADVSQVHKFDSFNHWANDRSIAGCQIGYFAYPPKRCIPAFQVELSRYL